MQDIRDYFMKEKKGDKKKITEEVDEIVIAYNKNNKENDVEGRGKAKKIKKKRKIDLFNRERRKKQWEEDNRSRIKRE